MTTLAHKCVRSFPNGDGLALTRGLRVKLNSGNVALAGSTEDEIGVVEQDTLATDAYCPVRLLSEGETIYMVASAAVGAVGATLYRAASGKVSTTQPGTAERIGVALETASGDGSLLEVLLKRLADVT